MGAQQVPLSNSGVADPCLSLGLLIPALCLHAGSEGRGEESGNEAEGEESYKRGAERGKWAPENPSTDRLGVARLCFRSW